MKYEYFKIDSRACGQGKTVDGIYKQINYFKSLDTPILLVCGSIELQNQYKAKYPEIILINSQNSKSTVYDVQLAMEIDDDSSKIICITHQTFMMLSSSEYRSKFMLIIDEAIQNVYESSKFYHKKNYHWEDHFLITHSGTQLPYSDCVAMDDFPRNEFYPLKVLNRLSFDDDMMFTQIKEFRQATDENYDHYITPYDYNIMMDPKNKEKRSFEIFSLLNQNIFNGWLGMYIAAAAFEKTPMYHLFKKFGLYGKFDTIHDFERTTGNFIFHCYSDFKWSNYKRKKSSAYLDNFHDYVNRNARGVILALRNKDELSKLNNELLLTHNVHGLNKEEYQSVVDISMESALLPSPQMNQFIKDHLLMDVIEKDITTTIIHFFSAYLFYQAIMRCKLRTKEYRDSDDKEQINIFLLDDDVVVALEDYFVFTIDNTSEIPGLPKELPMTTAERVRKSRAKQKELELQKKKSAEYKKKSRDKKKNLTHLVDSSLNIRT